MNDQPKREPGVGASTGPASLSAPITESKPTSLPSLSQDGGNEELRRALLEQLPPMDPSQVVPYGHLLDRTVKIRYEALRHLVKDRYVIPKQWIST